MDHTQNARDAHQAVCQLAAANGLSAVCDESECVFWRCAEHLDLEGHVEGCAIQNLEMLGPNGSEVAQWLLSVKDRVEQLLVRDPHGAAADSD